MVTTRFMGYISLLTKDGKVYKGEDVFLPEILNENKPFTSKDLTPCTRIEQKRKRVGKGSHILPIIKGCLQESENWKKIDTKEDYHFLGIQKQPCHNCNILFYTPDCTKLEQTADNSHFM